MLNAQTGLGKALEVEFKGLAGGLDPLGAAIYPPS